MMTPLRKILLVGHACSPHLGSEPGLTWNWAWHLSAHHRVAVITHPQYRANVERFLAAQPNPNLDFHWVTPPPSVDPWNPARGEKGIRLHYLLWQRLAYRQARRLQAQRGFDLVHHVSLGTVSAPPMLWRLPIPFVWGPLGGGQTAPPAFRSYFGADWRRETMRSLRVRLVARLPSLRRAVRRSALLLATNRETVRVLQEAGAPRVQLFIDNGIAKGHLPASVPQRSEKKTLTLLWAGRLEPRKALALALEAISHVRHLPVRLIVAGDGPLRAECENFAARMRLQDRVEFLGLVPWEKMPEVFGRADALLFTSLQDSFGSVVLEAMAHALPVLTLDHQGVGAFVPADAGIKVPVKGVKETVAGLAEGIRRLESSPEARWRMGAAGRAFASTQTWDRRAERMSELYEESLRSSRCN